MPLKLKSLGLLGMLTAITASINISPAFAGGSTIRVERNERKDICIDIPVNLNTKQVVQVRWGAWSSKQVVFEGIRTSKQILKLRANGNNITELYVYGVRGAGRIDCPGLFDVADVRSL
jgi:hypothetical protein